MSARNGDKARFHRIRKQKIQLRLRTRAFLLASGRMEGLSGTSESVVAAGAKPAKS